MIGLLTEINDTARSARTAGADAIEPRLLGVYRDRYDTIIAAGKDTNPAPPGQRATTGGRQPPGPPRRLRQRRAALLYVLPGTVFDRPGHFRISLTATMEMLERALPALREAGTGRPAQAR